MTRRAGAIDRAFAARSRGLEPTDSIRERILSTADCAQIEVWVSRVLQAKTAAEVLES